MDFTFLRPGKVHAALEGHPDRPSLRTVERWCAGEHPPEQWAVDLMQKRLIGTQKEAAPPKWAERLAKETANQVINAVKAPDQVAQLRTLIERLERLVPPPDATSGDPDDVQDPDASAPPGRAVG